MQPNPIPGQTNDACDRRYEAAVLARILWLHPTHLTERELLLDLFAESREMDAYERGPRRCLRRSPSAGRGVDPRRPGGRDIAR